jgi:ATP-dependent Clp protease adapter protein ClpS
MKPIMPILIAGIISATSTASEPSQWDFSQNEIGKWRPVNFTAVKINKGQGIQGISGKYPHLFSPALELPANRFQFIEITLKTGNKRGIIYFRKKDKPFAEARKLRYVIPAGKGFKTIKIDCRQSKNWNGMITGLRFDFGIEPGNHVTVKKIRFIRASKSPIITNWDFAQNGFEKWRPVNFKAVKINKGQGIQGISAKFPHIYSPELQINADKYKTLEIILKSDNTRGVIYFRKQNKPFAEARKLRYAIPAGKGFKTIKIDCSQSKNWNGIVTGLRLDFGVQPNNDVTIKAIRFKQASTGILPNDHFANAYFDKHLILEDWQVIPQNSVSIGKNIPGISLAPGGQIKSKKVELKRVTPLHWDLGESTTGKLKIMFFFKNIFDKPLSSKTIVDEKVKSGILNIPSNTAYVEVKIKNTDTRKSAIAQFVLTPQKAPQSDWHGYWLWHKEAGSKANASVYFYKSFNIKNIREITAANLQLTADDWQTVYLNGVKLVGPNHNSWQGIDIFPVKNLLKSGKNTLAIKVINAGGPAGLLAELNILNKSGRIISFSSDSSWKCFWGQLSTTKWWQYDDFTEKLQTPQVIGKANESLWGKIPFLPIKHMVLKVGDLILPSHLTSENEYLIRPKLTIIKEGTGKISDSLNLKFELKRIGCANIKLGCIDFPTKNFKDNCVTIKSFKLNLKHIPAGKYKFIISSQQAVLETKQSGWETNSDQAIQKEVTLSHSRSFNPAKAKLVNHATVPMIQINDQELVSPTHFLARMTNSDFNYQLIKNCTSNGIKGIWLHYDNWKYNSSGKYDFKNLDTMCSTILAQAPDSHIVVCIYLDSVGNMNMRSWNKKNTEELVHNDKGQPQVKNYSNSPEKSPSMASKAWLKEGDNILKALIAHIKKQPYGERVIGIVPSSGISWEWMYWGSQKGEFADYSKPYRNAFQKWVKEKYKNNLQRLNCSWHKNYKSFSEVTIPSRLERTEDDFFDLRRPAYAQYQIDFQEFFSHVVANAVCHYSNTVKKESNGRLLSGSYYGYINFLIWGSLSHNTGHFALKQVLNSPNIDLLMAPSRYSDRKLGEVSGFMSPEASIRLHNKLCINEADIRTQIANNKLGKVYTLDGARAVLEREMALVLVSGGTIRWFDFSKGWIAGDDRLMEVIKNLVRVEKEVRKLKIPVLDNKNSVAVISSEVATYYSGFKNSINHELVQRLYSNLFKTGAGFDFFVLSDLEKMPKYKCYIFTNIFKLTPEQRKYINEKLKRDGKTLVFFYAADVIGKKSIDTAAMSNLLEMQIKMQPVKVRQQVTLNSEGIKFFKEPKIRNYASKRPFGPIFYPISGMETLGVLADNKPGLALKRKQDYRILYSAVPAMPPELLRRLISSSGLPIYNAHEGDVTWAAGKLFSVHSKSGGRRTFSLPVKNGAAKELINNRKYQISNGKFSCNLSPGSTVLFYFTDSETTD